MFSDEACARVRPSRGRPLVVACLLVFSVLTGIAPMAANAGSEAEAEAVRLDEDLRKLAGRNAWDGVDGIYARLRSLESDGVTLSAVQHELGAEAALQLGRIREARGRFGLARNASADSVEKQRLQGVIMDIDDRFGSVVLTAAGKARRDASVRMSGAVFALDARAAISYANGEIQLSGSFDGLLPVGEYSFSAATFVVTSDGGVVRAEATVAGAPSRAAKDTKPSAEAKSRQKSEPRAQKPPREKPPREKSPSTRSGARPSAYVGLGAGSASWMSKSEGIGYYVPSGTGLSARVNGGMQVPVGAVSMIGELGWDGLFGSGGEKAAANLGTVGAGLGVGSTVHGRVLGQIGVGRASVIGVDPGPACRTEEWAMDVGDGPTRCEESAHWASSGIDYALVSPGLIVGGGVSPESLGGVAVTLELGLRGMSGQLVPWTARGIRYGLGGGQ